MSKFETIHNVLGEKVLIKKKKRTNLGFKSASSFVHQLTQKSFEKRGFAQAKLITHWSEIVGSELYNSARPVKISFPKSGLGATLNIEIDGAFGPEIDLQRESIKEKVNRVYGYTAVAKIRFTSSPSLGYGVKNKDSLVKARRDKNLKFERNTGISQATHNLISNFENINNQELRKTLNELSHNFIKKLSMNIDEDKE